LDKLLADLNTAKVELSMGSGDGNSSDKNIDQKIAEKDTEIENLLQQNKQLSGMVKQLEEEADKYSTELKNLKKNPPTQTLDKNLETELREDNSQLRAAADKHLKELNELKLKHQETSEASALLETKLHDKTIIEQKLTHELTQLKVQHEQETTSKTLLVSEKNQMEKDLRQQMYQLTTEKETIHQNFINLQQAHNNAQSTTETLSKELESKLRLEYENQIKTLEKQKQESEQKLENYKHKEQHIELAVNIASSILDIQDKLSQLNNLRGLLSSVSLTPPSSKDTDVPVVTHSTTVIEVLRLIANKLDLSQRVDHWSNALRATHYSTAHLKRLMNTKSWKTLVLDTDLTISCLVKSELEIVLASI
jgi:chromosome segregation ATPase